MIGFLKVTFKTIFTQESSCIKKHPYIITLYYFNNNNIATRYEILCYEKSWMIMRVGWYKGIQIPSGCESRIHVIGAIGIRDHLIEIERLTIFKVEHSIK